MVSSVERFRASRDVTLPYDLPSASPVDPVQENGSIDQKIVPVAPPKTQDGRRPAISPPAHSTGLDLETGQSMTSMKWRDPRALHRAKSQGLTRVGSALRSAHAQDFERRRPQVISPHLAGEEELSSDEDDREAHEDAAEDGEVDGGEGEGIRHVSRQPARVTSNMTGKTRRTDEVGRPPSDVV